MMSGSNVVSKERIYQAVQELREQEQIATRITIAKLADLKQSIVDDNLRTLVDEGRLKRLLRGVYELVETYPPPRPMFFGILDRGFVKLEVGDDVLTLTPQEARRIARGLGGMAEDARVLESTREHLFMTQEVSARVERQGFILGKLLDDLGVTVDGGC